MRFEKSRLVGADCRQSSWVSAVLSYTDCSHAQFDGADFMDADFSHANLHSVSDAKTQWSGARLDSARRTDEALARAENWQPAL